MSYQSFAIPELFDTLMQGKVIKINCAEFDPDAFQKNFANYVSRRRRELADFGMQEDIGVLKMRMLKDTCQLKIWLETKKEVLYQVIVEDQDQDQDQDQE